MALKDNLTVGGTIALLIGGSMFVYGLYERSQKVTEVSLHIGTDGVTRRVVHYLNAPPPCVSSTFEFVLSRAKADANKELVAYLQSLPTVNVRWGTKTVCSVRIWDDFKRAPPWQDFAQVHGGSFVRGDFYVEPPPGADPREPTTFTVDANHKAGSVPNPMYGWVSPDNVSAFANRQYLVERLRGNVAARLTTTRTIAEFWPIDARGEHLVDSRRVRILEKLPANTEVEVLDTHDPYNTNQLTVQVTGTTRRGWIDQKNLGPIPPITSTKNATEAKP